MLLETVSVPTDGPPGRKVSVPYLFIGSAASGRCAASPRLAPATAKAATTTVALRPKLAGLPRPSAVGGSPDLGRPLEIAIRPASRGRRATAMHGKKAETACRETDSEARTKITAVSTIGRIDAPSRGESSSTRQTLASSRLSR